MYISGSLRQRNPGAWELRVYLGVDADSGRQRWASKTVWGSRRYANAARAEFVADAGSLMSAAEFFVRHTDSEEVAHLADERWDSGCGEGVQHFGGRPRRVSFLAGDAHNRVLDLVW